MRLQLYSPDSWEAGQIVSSWIPSSKALLQILSEAISVSSRQRGRRTDDTDVLLASCRRAFLALVGDGNDRLSVALEVPDGIGADFVRAIEAILKVELLSEASLHAIKRVRAADHARLDRRTSR
ncbi:MAG: hypothetical protein AB7E81_20150 [Hyphomicrobiaceae bacterium]